MSTSKKIWTTINVLPETRDKLKSLASDVRASSIDELINEMILVYQKALREAMVNAGFVKVDPKTQEWIITEKELERFKQATRPLLAILREKIKETL